MNVAGPSSMPRYIRLYPPMHAEYSALCNGEDTHDPRRLAFARRV